MNVYTLLCIRKQKTQLQIAIVETDRIPVPSVTSKSYFTIHMHKDVLQLNTAHLHIPGLSLPIGAPTPNNNVYVLDDDAKPVPIGQIGIMWAGGAGITRGYINLPEKTAERYRYDPFVNDGLVALHDTEFLYSPQISDPLCSILET